MKAAYYNENCLVEMITVSQPKIRFDDEVLIKVRYVSICADDQSISPVFLGERVPGHEFSGEICDLGDESRRLGYRIGDRVTGYTWEFCGKCPLCRNGHENLCLNMRITGAMQEYIVLKNRQICRLPDSVPMEQGCMSELVASCIHAVERADIHMGDSVLILGGGGAGVVLLQIARMRGAANIAVSEPISKKRLLCQKLGADLTFDPYKENLAAPGLGYDCIIDASANANAVTGTPSLLAHGGTLVLFSLYAPENKLSINQTAFYQKEINVVNSFMAPYLLDRTMELLPRLNLEVLATTPFPLEQIKEAMAEASSKRRTRVTVQVTP